MEAIKVAGTMEKIVAKIGEERDKLEGLGIAVAQAESDYDKQMAVILIRLHNGEELEHMGKFIQKPPAATAKEIAKGICSETRLRLSSAHAKYNACKSNLTALQAQLNAFQSIFRHLEVV
jgi:hypothetical protein